MQLQTLIGTVKGSIYHLELNRPKQMNAMSTQFFKDMHTAYEEISKLDNIRVVVLTGRGKHFCAGLDIKEAPQMFQFPDELDQARKSIRIYDTIKDWQRSMTVLSRLRVPVIVGIQGFCIGGGIDLITAADIRYCTEDSKFTIKEIDIGMSPDIGTLQRLGIQATNQSQFRELAFTGKFFTAQEALQLGVVSKIVKDQTELDSDIFKLAELIASKSPVAIYTIKSILNREQNTEDHLDVMARTNMAMLFTNDVPLAIQASLMKSKAEFPKL